MSHGCQPHHFVIAYLPYTKNLFIRESHVPGIECCTHMLSEELVRRFVWKIVKYVFYHLIANVRFYHFASQICDTTRAPHK